MDVVPLPNPGASSSGGGFGTSGAKSWAHVVNPAAMAEMTIAEAESQLCPFGTVGECRCRNVFLRGILHLCFRNCARDGSRLLSRRYQREKSLIRSSLSVFVVNGFCLLRNHHVLVIGVVRGTLIALK